jgi:hypothetical protein
VGLKAQPVGEIEVAGPDLAGSLTNLGLIDEYRLYLHPIVLGRGQPFFSGPRPPLRLVTSDLVDEDVIRLTYVPANRATRPTDCAEASGPLWVHEATLTDASRVFVLTVRNREAKQAHPGQFRPLKLLPQFSTKRPFRCVTGSWPRLTRIVRH